MSPEKRIVGQPVGHVLIDNLAVAQEPKRLIIEAEVSQCSQRPSHSADHPITAALWQPTSEEFENARPVCRTGPPRSANHGQFIVVSQQGGGRNLARFPTRRHGRSCLPGGHSVSLASWVGLGKERYARTLGVIARMGLMPDSDGESVTPAGGTAVAERPVEEILAQTPWVTIVWDDPVNLMSYVTHVFVTYFHYTKSKAEKLMLQVHTTGKAIVSSGTREAMERDVNAMHEYGLWATLDKSEK